MRDDKIDLDREFILAQNSTDEQKRQHNIRQIKDPDERKNINTMVGYRDRQITLEERQLEKVRDDIANDIIRRDAQPKHELHLTPAGVAGMTPQQKAAAIRKSVEKNYGPVHAAQLERLRTDLGRQIDREIRGERVRQENRKSRTQPRSTRQSRTAPREGYKERGRNAAAITGRRNSPDRSRDRER